MVNRIIYWCLKNKFIVLLFAIGLTIGGYAAYRNLPIDAIPDIGEKQVLVYADWMGRSPQDVENQVTYRLSNGLSGTPGVKSIRTMSGFGFSMVFVIFKDDIDFYWARSRVLEKLNSLQQDLPDGVVPMLGADATALGQIYWYTVEGKGFDLEELRSTQDWYIRYQLQSVEGVSEVSSVGGFVKQYQIDINPDQMRAANTTLPQILEAISKSNRDVGAKVIEKNGSEFFIRGVGLIRNLEDLGNIVLHQENGTPLLLKQIASIKVGPEFRRGALDKNGAETVGGVVLMRFGENPAEVLARVKDKMKLIEKGLPEKTLANGELSKIKIVPFYDRSEIIQETMDTLKQTLIEETILAAFIVFIFLLHIRTTIAIIPTLPLGIAASFILMYYLNVNSNIMALAGLAIAIGAISDMGIIVAENIHRHLSQASEERRKNDFFQIIYEGASEVGGAVVTAVSNTLVSFIPVFFLTDQEGKLFKPLAYTKTFAMGASVVLAVTLVPVLCYLLYKHRNIQKKYLLPLTILIGAITSIIYYISTHLISEASSSSGILLSIVMGLIAAWVVYRITTEDFISLETNKISNFIFAVYKPSLQWVLSHKKTFLLAPLMIFFLGMSVWLGLQNTLSPLAWAVNLFAHENITQEDINESYYNKPNISKRPLLDLGQLRFQKIQTDDDKTKYRLLVRHQTIAEKQKDTENNINIVKEYRILPGLGREFMPPLDEGSFLYMPSLLPQASLTEVAAINSLQDRNMMRVPEVEMVVGKLGRTESALDPAPISMIETIVRLKPESEWRKMKVTRFYQNYPEFLKKPLRFIWPEERTITKSEILAELQGVTKIPGVLPTWLQPIQTRLIMLQTGLRSMMGVKIYGDDLKELERIGLEMEPILQQIPGATDVIADRTVGKPYLEIAIDRIAIARYGLTIDDVQLYIEHAIGGNNIGEVLEGRAQYPIRVRLQRDFRENLEAIGNIPVATPDGALVPLKELTKIETVLGPQEIKGEKGLLVSYVTLNTRDRDEVSVVEDAERHLQQALKDGKIHLPAGYFWEWSGQFENQVRATERMKWLIPITLLIILLSLHFGYKRWWVSFVIFSGVLVSASGGFIMLELWQANLSVAVWVGFLALFGVASDDGVIIATYLEGVFKDQKMTSIEDIRKAVLEAGLKRIRPCLMTTFTTIIGLMPIFWVDGRGADVMRPMAIPSVGGMTVSLITLFIVPCLFCAIEEFKWHRQQK